MNPHQWLDAIGRPFYLGDEVVCSSFGPSLIFGTVQIIESVDPKTGCPYVHEDEPTVWTTIEKLFITDQHGHRPATGLYTVRSPQLVLLMSHSPLSVKTVIKELSSMLKDGSRVLP